MCTFLFLYFFFDRRAVNVSKDCSEHPRDASCQIEETDLSRLLQLLKEKDGAIHQLQQKKLIWSFPFSLCHSEGTVCFILSQDTVSVRGDSVFHSLTEYSVSQRGQCVSLSDRIQC